MGQARVTQMFNTGLSWEGPTQGDNSQFWSRAALWGRACSALYREESAGEMQPSTAHCSGSCVSWSGVALSGGRSMLFSAQRGHWLMELCTHRAESTLKGVFFCVVTKAPDGMLLHTPIPASITHPSNLRTSSRIWKSRRRETRVYHTHTSRLSFPYSPPAPPGWVAPGHLSPTSPRNRPFPASHLLLTH